MPCNNADVPGRHGNLEIFKEFKGAVNFGDTGTGTRDHNFTTEGPVTLPNPSLPYETIKAYLYWNVICGKDEHFDHANFNGADLHGDMIAHCGNTLWPRNEDEDDGPISWKQSNIINKVYRADVTDRIEDSNEFSIHSKPSPDIKDVAGNPHYPGCRGSQGVVLITVFKLPGADRKIIIYDGAVQLTPAIYQDFVGGVDSYTVGVNAGEYVYNASFLKSLGDAQPTAPCQFSWNNDVINPSLTPNAGNLLHSLIENDLDANASNTAKITTPGDGTCWFLSAYVGSKPCAPPCQLPILEDLPAAPYDEMSLFQEFTGKYNIIGDGQGTRDKNTNINPAHLRVDVPGKPYKAYLYWNVLAKGDINAVKAVFAGNKITGAVIGYTGDTCWKAADDGTHTDGAETEQNIFNLVYRADVTQYICKGNNSYSVSLPGISRNKGVAYLSSDSAHYPGCCGSQGVALIVIYHDPCVERKILIFDGAKLVLPESAIPLNGGTVSYEFAVNVGQYTQKAKIIASMGDAQTEYSDTFTWNGDEVFPPNGFGSCINPNVGNLLFYDETGVDALPMNVAELDCSSGTECLCWFLFCYRGQISCCCNKPDPNAPRDQLKYFRGFIGDVDFVVNGAGTRDFNTNITPAEISITVPGPVVKAYLYWNTLGQKNFDPFVAILDGNRVEGCFIGWCGDTCWLACPDGTGADGATDEQYIINRVYRADVTSLVSGSGTYTVSLPGVSTHPPPIAFLASDTPHYPGCHGSQGVVLLVIYENPESFMKETCCPCHPLKFVKRKQVLIYDGCVLMTPHPGYPGPDGGTPEYSVEIDTYYNNNIKIATAAGDAQTQYDDEFQWDGVPFPDNPYDSYWNPYCGNLLHVKVENPGGTGPCCTPKHHVATAIADGTDCYSWFLFVYYGEKICLDSKITVRKR